MKHVSFALLSALANGSNALMNVGQEELTRIIGGSEAIEDRHTYAVLLIGSGSGCGGSLIARDVVLTAAHCEGVTDYAVLGRHDLNDRDGEVFAVREVIPHPSYSNETYNNDFMLLFLAGASTDDNVITVKLNSDPSVPIVGQTLTVVGWGDTDVRPGHTPPDVLLSTNVNVISNEECDASEGYDESGEYWTYKGSITDDMICAEANGTDSCQGDSGGPLFIKGDGGAEDVQVGVVSYGIGCGAVQFPGVYARVSHAYKWIQSEVCEGSGYASEAGFDCSTNNDNDQCIICPNGATAGDDYAPYADIEDSSTCAEIIDAGKSHESWSEWCGEKEAHEFYCCPTVPENPCIICPNGATAGDDFAPYADGGDATTCAEIIDAAKYIRTGTESCGWAEEYELSCCPSAPVIPCTICRSGAAAGDDFACSEFVEGAKQFETDSDYCQVIGEVIESACCPTDPIFWPACIICPGGATAGNDFAPFTDDGDFTTCAEFIDYFKQFESESEDCGLAEFYELACCPTAPENPCIICQDGVTATGGDDFAPYANSGDLATCAELIQMASLFESGSHMCGYSEIDELSCCPTVPENPCIICPNGATAGDDFVPNAGEGDTSSCSDSIELAKLFESGSSYCGISVEVDGSNCCPPEVDNTCIICPDGATAGDDFVPEAYIDSNVTCSELIYAAESYEADSAWCELSKVDAVYCCPAVPVNPCVICPFGAFAGDDFVPRESSGSTMTCKELIDFAKLFESGSYHCDLIETDEALCCPLVVNTTSTPSPVESMASSPSSGPIKTQSPTSASPAEPPSGGANASGLVGFAFVSIVTTIYAITLA